ncbi:MAG: prepilin peptidase [Coriobacteriia bacterium]|nr:prepilin peptidase [Coriobacteriia bacterium]MBS5477969.1 prepilin peptidase [Coriobacteriia bacterium]
MAVACAWACVSLTLAALGTGAFVDAIERRIPNACVVIVALCALVQLALHASGLLVSTSFSGLAPDGSRLLSAAGVLGVLLAAEALWRAMRGRHGIGLGDVKLLSALALWLGPGIVAVLFLASLAGCAVSLARGQRTFAFGPYIALAGGACLMLRLFAQLPW